MVSPIAGTTRDAVDSLVEHDGLTIRFVDTAGIRRKGKTELKAEKLSVVMARRHLERSDVAILVIDATEGVTALDAHIAGYAHEAGRSVIIAVNKWDVVQKTHRITADFDKYKHYVTEQTKGALAPQEMSGHFVRYTHYMVYEAKRFQQVYEWMRSWGLATGDADHARVVASL